MKPTRNRVMCPDCGRAKMLFESECSARNFIKFNGDDIDTHGGKLRVYYCPACCGYHISSKPYKEGYSYRTENLIKRYKEDIENSKKKVKDIINNSTFDNTDILLIADKILAWIKSVVDNTITLGKTKRREYVDWYVGKYYPEIKQKYVDEIRHIIYTSRI